MPQLSILIPSRREMFTAKTVENLLENIEGDTEILIGLDGEWSDPGIVDDKRVRIVRYPQSIGQRAMTNQLARLSTAKYIAKCDAHCSFDKGFDRILMENMQDDWTVVPVMKNLHAFDWVCPDGHRRYQSPSGPCKDCGKPTERDVLWFAKPSPNSTAYCFDPEPHFQYFNEYKKRQQGDLVETMSLQGSFFMITRDKYWELGICDEQFGSWGSQGIEVAVKTWLSGGRVLCNRKTWYAHMFRTQGGDFSFPYEQKQSSVNFAKKRARQIFFENKWDKQVYPLSWLVEKFWPVYGWKDEDLTKLKQFDHVMPPPATERGIIYYTDNRLRLSIARPVQKQIKSIAKDRGLPIVSATLKPMAHMGHNIRLKGEPSYLMMFKQILTALQASRAKYVFFTEHDVLYHPSHFDFTPPRDDRFYYNFNWWCVRTKDGLATHWDAYKVSQLCANRELLIGHYRKRVAIVEEYGYNNSMGFEPGAHNTEESVATRDNSAIPKDIYVDDILMDSWRSESPNIDIRGHGQNLSDSKWSLKDFRDKAAAVNFTQSTVDKIPSWEHLKL